MIDDQPVVTAKGNRESNHDMLLFRRNRTGGMLMSVRRILCSRSELNGKSQILVVAANGSVPPPSPAQPNLHMVPRRPSMYQPQPCTPPARDCAVAPVIASDVIKCL